MPNFTFCRGHEHKATTFLFFSWTLIQSFRIQLQKNLPTFDELNIRWNKGNKVWGSIHSFLNHVFVTAAIVHWCLSYLVIFFQCGGCLFFCVLFFWGGGGGGRAHCWVPLSQQWGHYSIYGLATKSGIASGYSRHPFSNITVVNSKIPLYWLLGLRMNEDTYSLYKLLISFLKSATEHKVQ